MIEIKKEDIKTVEDFIKWCKFERSEANKVVNEQKVPHNYIYGQYKMRANTLGEIIEILKGFEM